MLSTIDRGPGRAGGGLRRADPARPELRTGGTHGVRVAGRSATVVSAISPSGLTAARWWMDDDAGPAALARDVRLRGSDDALGGLHRGDRSVIPTRRSGPGRRIRVPMTTTSLTVASTGRAGRGRLALPGRSIAGLSPGAAPDRLGHGPDRGPSRLHRRGVLGQRVRAARFAWPRPGRYRLGRRSPGVRQGRRGQGGHLAVGRRPSSPWSPTARTICSPRPSRALPHDRHSAADYD